MLKLYAFPNISNNLSVTIIIANNNCKNLGNSISIADFFITVNYPVHPDHGSLTIGVIMGVIMLITGIYEIF